MSGLCTKAARSVVQRLVFIIAGTCTPVRMSSYVHASAAGFCAVRVHILLLCLSCTCWQGSAAERPEELARPHLHEFLAACYEHYDIVIWSATSMKWIEVCRSPGLFKSTRLHDQHLA